jgi:hypothetical protein
MQRRNILALLAGLAIAAPMVVGAQQKGAKKPVAVAQAKVAKDSSKAGTKMAMAAKADSTKPGGKKKAKKHKKVS